MESESNLEKVANLCAAVVDGRPSDTDDLSFEALGLDSFDLVDVRTRVEEVFGTFTDSEWLALATMGDIRVFVSARSATPRVSSDAAPAQSSPVVPSPLKPRGDREWQLNMPGMAVGGLSEGWLFREMGDLHWEKLCTRLGQASNALLDEAGDRLYATFVRVRWEGTCSLRDWNENDRMVFESEQHRLGRSVIVSTCTIDGPGRSIHAELMTTFAVRDGGNDSLRKTTPTNIAESGIPVLTVRPPLATGYHAARSDELASLTLAGVEIALTSDVVFTHAHSINPYYEINGVNLLYFAGYALISDQCERAVVHKNRDYFGVRGDWSMVASTIARDVFYFSNCNLEDTVIYTLNACVAVDGHPNRVALVSTLSRKSDGRAMARIVAVKEVHDV